MFLEQREINRRKAFEYFVETVKKTKQRYYCF